MVLYSWCVCHTLEPHGNILGLETKKIGASEMHFLQLWNEKHLWHARNYAKKLQIDWFLKMIECGISLELNHKSWTFKLVKQI